MERAWVEILAPGNTPPVDLVPFLTYFPEMFANWKVRARKIRDWQRQLYTTLVEGCKSRYKPGKSNANLLDTAYERSDEWGLTKEMIVSLGGATMEGGSGSTASFIQGFVLFMMAYPEVQRKAKEELDIVVGPHRKPTLDDIENLPYLRAVIKEMSRIRPIAPISMPHSILQEVYYKGYRLPADAMLFVNTYGIFHDEALFEDPEEFRPERYIQHPLGLKPNAEIDPVSARILETLPFSIGRESRKLAAEQS
ncbi:hypothetical protein FRC03_009143 [Tulasnella sp. 419]|nr:hypothetical protein FRC03_009143 [Tulasnella sp. 419]